MTDTSNRKQAIVIGGGIAGLTTCYRLVAESAKRGITLDVKLLEAGDRVGGAIHTSKQDGFIIEHGPDVFISTKPWAKALVEELGIADQFLGTNPKERRSFVLRKGKLYPVPDGFYLMAPAFLYALREDTDLQLGWKTADGLRFGSSPAAEAMKMNRWKVSSRADWGRRRSHG